MKPSYEHPPANPQIDYEPTLVFNVRAGPVRAFPRRRLIDTSDVEETRRAFSSLYIDSKVEPTRGIPFHCTLDVTSCGPVRAVASIWGGGVAKLVMPTLHGQYLLGFAAEGNCEGDHAGESLGVAPSLRGMLCSPDRPTFLKGGPGYHGRALVIEGGALAAHFRTLTGRELPAPLLFDAHLNIEQGAGVIVHALAQLFRSEIDRPGASPLSVAGLCDALFTSLLTNTHHSMSALLDAPPPRVAPGVVRRAEEFMVAHANEPITLNDIVAAAGAPARSLRAAFAAFRGTSPMAFLRQHRFELARRRLSEATADTTVAGVVAALGLGGAGRFSVEYRKRFGESPSVTLAAGRAGVGSRLRLRVTR